MPAATRYVVVEGATHAFFGDYGIQPGDGQPSIEREATRAQIVAASLVLLREVSSGANKPIVWDMVHYQATASLSPVLRAPAYPATPNTYRRIAHATPASCTGGTTAAAASFTIGVALPIASPNPAQAIMERSFS